MMCSKPQKLDFNQIKSYQELMDNKQSMTEFSYGGSFGVFFKFISKANDICTIKQIRICIDHQKEETIQKLDKLIQFLSSHNHKNIIRGYFGFTHYLDENNLYYYMGMELINDSFSSELYRLINKTKEFSNELIYNYALQLCDALYCLEMNDFAHCNVKPSNILITGDNILKLCWFSEAHMQTQTKVYIAPEQFKKSQEIIPIKADVYSYGIIILQCFLGCDTTSIGFLNETSEVSASSYLESKFQDEDMKNFFQKCLCHNPEERFGFKDIKIFLENKMNKQQHLNQDKTTGNNYLTLEQVKKLIKNETETIKQYYSNENTNLKNQQQLLLSEIANLKNYQNDILNENLNLKKQYNLIQKENEGFKKSMNLFKNEINQLNSQIVQLKSNTIEKKIKPPPKIEKANYYSPPSPKNYGTCPRCGSGNTGGCSGGGSFCYNCNKGFGSF